jgi:hypothetical protein
MYARRLPVPKPQGEYIDTSVHWILARRFFDQDGSISAGPYLIERGDADHRFVEGMRVMAPDGSPAAVALDVILRLIEEHGACEVEIVR